MINPMIAPPSTAAMSENKITINPGIFPPRLRETVEAQIHPA